MTDERKFATAKMNKPMNLSGDIIAITGTKTNNGQYKIQPAKKDNRFNFRLFLYIIYIPLLLIDWTATLLTNITELTANSIKELTLNLESYINANTKPAKQEK
jgi:hypothetical protein